MVQNISPRRGAAISGFASLVLLAAVAAFDNQWLASWRAGRGAPGGDTAHSWFAGPVTDLGALGWRATKESGEPGRVFFGMLAEPLIAVVLTFLLLMLVCRGVGAERGRWALFLGAWFATALAASAALIAGSGIAATAVAGGMFDDSGGTSFARGESYHALIQLGLRFGLCAGWLVGFVAVLVYGSTAASNGESLTQEYESPAIDYSDYSGASSSSAASGGLPRSSADYSFSPTSPYSPSESAGYGGYSPANAPTEVSSAPEDEPYGGERPY